ncbi:MAG: hypothetical protein AAF408_00870 [Pseudomonadota bacterium]
MIWTTKTHSYASTVCRHSGEPCPALARLAEKLADALMQARPATTDDFTIEGSVKLPQGQTDCTARFCASHDRIRIFCGVDSEAELGWLDRLADALFSHGETACLPSGGPIPSAMVEVLPRTDRASRHPMVDLHQGI